MKADRERPHRGRHQPGRRRRDREAVPDGLKSGISASREARTSRNLHCRSSSSASSHVGVRGPMIDHEQLLRYLAERWRLGPASEGRVASARPRGRRAAARRRGRRRGGRRVRDRAGDHAAGARGRPCGKHEADFAYSMPGVGRFRVQRLPAARLDQHRDAAHPRSAARRSRSSVSRRSCRELSDQHRGLVLVTGPDRIGQDHDASPR